MTKAQDHRSQSVKEQAYSMIKTKDSRTQRQSNLNKFKEARFNISPQEFEDHTLGEICMIRRSNFKFVTPFSDPKRQFHSRRELTPSSIHNMYSFYESKASETECEEIGEVDIDTPTMEQYMGLTQGATRIWMDKLPRGSINTWDLLEKVFIQKYCPPSKIAKQLEEIHNFKQEMDETLCRA
nr:hypothetical protein [Tanacetum cinerariifolium]